jgi:hypothetical protein
VHIFYGNLFLQGKCFFMFEGIFIFTPSNRRPIKHLLPKLDISNGAEYINKHAHTYFMLSVVLYTEYMNRYRISSRVDTKTNIMRTF